MATKKPTPRKKAPAKSQGKAKREGVAKLTPKQRVFVEHVQKGLPKTKAAAKAGYAGPRENHKNVGTKLMKDPYVRLAIAAESQGIKLEKATKEVRQDFWTQVMANEYVDMKDRLKASELLGKSEGDFIDKVEHTGKLTLGALVLGSFEAPPPALPPPPEPIPVTVKQYSVTGKFIGEKEDFILPPADVFTQAVEDDLD